MNIKGLTSGLRSLIGDNQYFIIPFVLFCIIGFSLLSIYGNTRLFLDINRLYSQFADHFFLMVTNLGDGAIPYILVFVLLWVSFREALTFLIITILLTILVTILKRYFFPEIHRPVFYFEFFEKIRILKGYDPPALFSFPSGHSATAFSVFFYISILAKNHLTKFLLFCSALLVSFSRIYISAHFPADVLAGSCIAMFLTILCYCLSRNLKYDWIDKRITFVPNIFPRIKTA